MKAVRLMLSSMAAMALVSPVTLANNHYGSTICPMASAIHGKFDVAIPDVDGQSYYVFSTKTMESNRRSFWLAVGNFIKADSQQAALVKANNLLATISGPVFEKPSVYTVPENGASYMACQYVTSDNAVTINAIFDDAYGNDIDEFNRYTYHPHINGCGGGICRRK